MTVPPRGAMPPGFIHVPAGRFLFGTIGDELSRREFLLAQPLHAVETAAFWIARTEVTYADWLAYLRALPPDHWLDYLLALSPDERVRQDVRHIRFPSTGVTLEERDGRFTLSLAPVTGADLWHRAREGEPLVYPGRKVRKEVRWERLPVSGISYLDAQAYTACLDRTGRVPGARLCTVHEWERAARGADGRVFPHGDVLHPGDANIDLTYGRVDNAYGPDEVGSFPASHSPYDLADLAGNVWDWTTDAKGKPLLKGGSFFQPPQAAMSSNANPGAASLRNVRTGLRVCADAARAR
jgi:formylglycine-generating enzyme required for sulfatase activity